MPNNEKTRVLGVVPACLLALVLTAIAGSASAESHARAQRLVVPAASRAPVKMTRPPSAFVQLAATVSRAPAAERVDFARTAILTMADQYWVEVDKARAQLHADPERRRKALRWSAATLEYLHQLYDTADLIDDSTLVEIVPGAGDSVHLIVNGAPVVLSGPRIGDPDSLGREIVSAFCRLRPCVVDAPVAPESLRSDGEVSGNSGSGWSFADGAGTTFVTGDGIHFMFSSIQDRERKQKAALALAHDVRQIANALTDVAIQGYEIEWDRMRLSDSPVAGEHKLMVNRRGDYLLLRIPSLGRSTAFFTTSLSWIRARVEGRKLTLFVPQAEHVISPLLQG